MKFHCTDIVRYRPTGQRDVAILPAVVAGEAFRRGDTSNNDRRIFLLVRIPSDHRSADVVGGRAASRRARQKSTCVPLETRWR
jgi:hypothetical protein